MATSIASGFAQDVSFWNVPEKLEDLDAECLNGYPSFYDCLAKKVSVY